MITFSFSNESHFANTSADPFANLFNLFKVSDKDIFKFSISRSFSLIKSNNCSLVVPLR
jgi:hypothetical protein